MNPLEKDDIYMTLRRGREVMEYRHEIIIAHTESMRGEFGDHVVDIVIEQCVTEHQMLKREMQARIDRRIEELAAQAARSQKLHAL